MDLRRPTTALLLGTLALLLTACGAAAAGDGGEITVSDARVPVPAGANGAAYMTLSSDGGGDRLVGASTDIAEAVELHETTAEDGSMAMQPVDGVEIPAGGEAVLEPGGLHVMLIDVTEELAEGDTVDITLTFENAGEQTVSAEVVPTGDMPGTEMGSETEMDPESMEMGSES